MVDNMKTIVHATKRTTEDISLPAALDWLHKQNQEITELPYVTRNARIRLRDAFYTDVDDVECTVSVIEVLYERKYTDEEKEATRDFLATRKAEREAAARVQFDRLRARYGW